MYVSKILSLLLVECLPYICGQTSQHLEGKGVVSPVYGFKKIIGDTYCGVSKFAVNGL
jgi:hypothetical protein